MNLGHLTFTKLLIIPAIVVIVYLILSLTVGSSIPSISSETLGAVIVIGLIMEWVAEAVLAKSQVGRRTSWLNGTADFTDGVDKTIRLTKRCLVGSAAILILALIISFDTSTNLWAGVVIVAAIALVLERAIALARITNLLVSIVESDQTEDPEATTANPSFKEAT